MKIDNGIVKGVLYKRTVKDSLDHLMLLMVYELVSYPVVVFPQVCHHV